jgi:hypothetical protein
MSCPKLTIHRAAESARPSILPPMTQATPAATARLIHLALVGGVVTATVILALVQRVASPVSASILLYATFGIGATMFAGALLLSARIPREGAARDPDGWWRVNLPQAIVVWALAEGPALLGAVAHFVTGSLLPYTVTGVGLLLLAFLGPARLTAE